MLYDFILADKSAKKPMYRQIYISIRNAIENGNLKKGTKLLPLSLKANRKCLMRTIIK